MAATDEWRRGGSSPPALRVERAATTLVPSLCGHWHGLALALVAHGWGTTCNKTSEGSTEPKAFHGWGPPRKDAACATEAIEEGRLLETRSWIAINMFAGAPLVGGPKH